MNNTISIFNDVIGPIMRGPSSSHTAASWRIARICLELLNDGLVSALIEFDEHGAWAPNFREQGTVMGINGGLLGFDIIDPRMKNTKDHISEIGLEVNYRISSFPTIHANTVRLTLKGISGKTVQVVAASTGGGSFEIQSINNVPISMNGDCYELLVFSDIDLTDELGDLIGSDIEGHYHQNGNLSFLRKSYSKPINADLITKLQQSRSVKEILTIKAILPIVAGNESELPFTNIDSLIDYANKNKLDLGDIGLLYEKRISGLSEPSLFQMMNDIIDTIDISIQTGLRGTHYNDRILHQQSHLIKEAESSKKIPKGSIISRIIENTAAIMESKSAMEIVVAYPTAGSCGTVGGLISAVSQSNSYPKDEIAKAYFAAGIIGVYFAYGPGFSAEEHGCQVECGAASGMAAAAIVQLYGGSAKQAIDAASMAIQNMIGLICDPVADRVEVPCLGKNISAALNALSSATMAVSGFNSIIPLDQVLETVSLVSQDMPSCVKCTGKGGLSITKAAFDLKDTLKS